MPWTTASKAPQRDQILHEAFSPVLGHLAADHPQLVAPGLRGDLWRGPTSLLVNLLPSTALSRTGWTFNGSPVPDMVGWV